MILGKNVHKYYTKTTPHNVDTVSVPFPVTHFQCLEEWLCILA
jgi:hypothetical protein